MYFVLYILVYTEPFNLYTQHHSSLHWILWVTDANQCPQSPFPPPQPHSPVSVLEGVFPNTRANIYTNE